MPGLYSSRATKFLYLDGARMTGADGPLTKSESETELLSEKFMPEGSARPVVVQSGLSNEMISLEGYARRESGAANLILSDDAHTLAGTPERIVTVGDFGDIVGQQATLHRAMSLAEGWKTIPGELLLQFSGTLKTARGQAADIQEGTIIRSMRTSVGEHDTAGPELIARFVDLGAASNLGFLIVYQIQNIEFKDWGTVTIGIQHSASKVTVGAHLAAANVSLNTPGANGETGPLARWILTAGAARRYVAPRFTFSGGAGLSLLTSVTYHCAIVRL